MYLRRATNHVNGVATGGTDESGFDIQPQESLFSVNLWGSQTREVVLPKGSIITATSIIPRIDKGAAPTGGTVKIETWNRDTGAAIATVLAATTAAAYLKTPIETPVQLTADTRLRFTATAVVPNTGGNSGDGVVAVGISVILPPIRS